MSIGPIEFTYRMEQATLEPKFHYIIDPVTLLRIPIMRPMGSPMKEELQVWMEREANGTD